MVLLHATSGPLSPADLSAYQAKLKGLPDVGSVSPAQVSASRATAAYTVTLTLDPTSTAAVHAVEGPIRTGAHAAAPAGTYALVGGTTAVFATSRSRSTTITRWCSPVAAAIILVMLGLMLRGLGRRAVLDGPVGLVFLLPVYIYVFVVALGTDYNILMVARLREETAEGRSPREAAALALRHAGRGARPAPAGRRSRRWPRAPGQLGFAVSSGIVLAAFVVATFSPQRDRAGRRAAWWPARKTRASLRHGGLADGGPGSTIRLVSALDLLVSRLPADTVSTNPKIMTERATDSWTLDLLRRVRGDELAEPAAVVFPASTGEVAVVLAWATETGTAVIPRGAGSGVCGGARAQRGAVVLDLARMDRIGDVDLVSQTVTVQAGVRGDRLEDALARHDLTTGHYPQSIAISTVGGWIAASSAGQASTGFGAIEDIVLGLTAVLPTGEVLRCRAVPRSAAGPDLRRLLIGSEGTLAVVTEATLACRSRPAAWTWLAFGFADFEALAGAVREVRQADTGAAVLRGYDETDAQFNFGALGDPPGCVGLAGFPDGPTRLAIRSSTAAEIMRQAGTDLDHRAYGTYWDQHRNDAVQTYAQVMGPERAFGPGAIVDTMEVAGLWSAVPRLHQEIKAALAPFTELAGCHLSHLYRSGSSLYFTFLINGTDERDAEAKYRQAWDQAAASCAGAGGTITHHHGVGRLKAPYLPAELGPEGVAVLDRIRTALDPAQIMNPGGLRP